MVRRAPESVPRLLRDKIWHTVGKKFLPKHPADEAGISGDKNNAILESARRLDEHRHDEQAQSRELTHRNTVAVISSTTAKTSFYAN